MSAIASENTEQGPRHQLQNFLTLKAKVIHTDELIGRYREKGQECACLQEQLRQSQSQEASLKQGMVGLKAEMQALVEENSGLQEALVTHHCEREVIMARATNAELLVRQLTAQVEDLQMAEANIREERDSFAEQCSLLQDQLKKALQLPVGGRCRSLRHRFPSTASLPPSLPLSVPSNGPLSLTSVSLSGDIPSLSQPVSRQDDVGDKGSPPPRSEFSQDDICLTPLSPQPGSEVNNGAAVGRCSMTKALSKMVDLDLSISDSSSVCSDLDDTSVTNYEQDEPDNAISWASSSASANQPHTIRAHSPFPVEHSSSLHPSLLSPLPSHVSPLPSPLVHAAADTMNSDSDSELSLSEVESLSPIPPSPHPRLPTLSPLPLSPAQQSLSPLPHSPPPHSLLPPAACVLPEFLAAAPDSSNVCVPVPSVCVTSSPPPSATLSHQHQSTLQRSHCSPFLSTRIAPPHTMAKTTPERLSLETSQPHTSLSATSLSATSQPHTVTSQPHTSLSATSQPHTVTSQPHTSLSATSQPHTVTSQPHPSLLPNSQPHPSLLPNSQPHTSLSATSQPHHSLLPNSQPHASSPHSQSPTAEQATVLAMTVPSLSLHSSALTPPVESQSSDTCTSSVPSSPLRVSSEVADSPRMASMSVVKACGRSAEGICSGHYEVEEGVSVTCSAAFVVPAGGDTVDVPAGGATVDEVPAGGDTVDKVPAGGDTVDEVPAGRDAVDEVPAGGDTVDEVPAGGDTVDVVPAGGDTVDEVPAGRDTVDEVPAGGDTVDEVPAGRDTVDEVPAGGDTVDEVPAGGDTVDVVPAGGDTVDEVPAGGDTVDEVPAGGDTVDEVPAGGDTVDVVPAGGDTVDEVPAGGDTVDEVPAAGDTVDVVPAGEDTVDEVPAGGDTVDEVPAAGDTVDEVPAGGDTVDEVPAVGDTVDEVPAGGDTVDEVPAGGDTVDEVPAGGDTVDEVPAGGDTVDEVPAGGDTVDEVPAGGDTVDEVPAGGDTVDEVPAGGDTVDVVPAGGDTVDEVPAGGDTVDEVPAGGDTVDEVPAGGDTVDEVPAGGDTVDIVPAVGESILTEREILLGGGCEQQVEMSDMIPLNSHMIYSMVDRLGHEDKWTEKASPVEADVKMNKGEEAASRGTHRTGERVQAKSDTSGRTADGSDGGAGEGELEDGELEEGELVDSDPTPSDGDPVGQYAKERLKRQCVFLPVEFPQGNISCNRRTEAQVVCGRGREEVPCTGLRSPVADISMSSGTQPASWKRLPTPVTVTHRALDILAAPSSYPPPHHSQSSDRQLSSYSLRHRTVPHWEPVPRKRRLGSNFSKAPKPKALRLADKGSNCESEVAKHRTLADAREKEGVKSMSSSGSGPATAINRVSINSDSSCSEAVQTTDSGAAGQTVCEPSQGVNSFVSSHLPKVVVETASSEKNVTHSSQQVGISSQLDESSQFDIQRVGYSIVTSSAEAHTSHPPANGSAEAHTSHSPANGSAEAHTRHPPANGSAEVHTGHPPANGSAEAHTSHPPANGSAEAHTRHPPANGSAEAHTRHPPANGSAEAHTRHPPANGSAEVHTSHPPANGSAEAHTRHPPANGSAEVHTGHPPANGSAEAHTSHPPANSSAEVHTGHPPANGSAEAHNSHLPATGSAEAHTRHVLLTDRATGQVEELTPLSSPAADSLPSLGEILAEPPSSTGPPQATLQGPGPSVLQQSLCEEFRCPLPLPEWLVAGMVRVQAMGVHTPHPPPRKKKKKSPCNAVRLPKQKPLVYVGACLEQLVTGRLPLSAVVNMFADSWNCPNVVALCKSLAMYLRTSYLPRSDQVVFTYNSICSDVQANRQLCPTSPSFPPALLRPECQFVALLYHTAKLNPSMSSLLPEVATTLSAAALSPALSFHRMAAIARLFTAVCRLLGERERVLFLCFDLLRRPLTSSECPVVTGMVGVWPAVFARREGVGVVVGARLNPAGVEAQPLSYTVEVVVTVMLRHGGFSHHHFSNLHTLCKWGTGQKICMKTVDKLASVLMQLLQTSRNVTVEQLPCQGWSRPRPSHLTFQLVHSLRLLAWFKGWVWTSDVLIKAHIWPILQAWNCKKDSVPEATVMAVVRLLGFIGQQGASSGASSLAQLQKLLLSLLLRPQETPLSIQLCAAESLIDLCPPSLPSSRDAVAILWQWLRSLAGHPAGPHLSREFCPKLASSPQPSTQRPVTKATQGPPTDCHANTTQSPMASSSQSPSHCSIKS